MSLQMTDTQQALYTLTAKDAKGAPTSLGDVPEWSLSNPDVASLQVAADGLSALVVAKLPGRATIGVHDPASGLNGSDEITIVGSATASINLTAGAPEEQPV